MLFVVSILRVSLKSPSISLHCSFLPLVTTTSCTDSISRSQRLLSNTQSNYSILVELITSRRLGTSTAAATGAAEDQNEGIVKNFTNTGKAFAGKAEAFTHSSGGL